ncbi:acyltransferase family protein [Citrobacter farmeri]|uniref:acyltransferase family protein n=1 Tax=Citrobacter amalonaticus TaxID=35703 RepID=UPI0002B618FB|nr:acyltransferase family protein [Citrobacter amalonaticus]EKV5654677.1 acyltransferase [Citrobacter farmeri]
MQFRKDINGLRALAVIGVILFHFDKNWLPGGFAGVDVFFVISGFLMTKIILTGLDSDSFSIWKFYLARAKRIIPALCATCIICLFVGWCILLPKDYAELAANAVSSILFFSNYWYASQTGYFDTSSLDNILLHTWSLSAEWQFYLVYPLALSCIYYFLGGKLTRRAIYIGVIISLGLSIYRTPINPTDSYFTLATRAWEMLAGGLAFTISEAGIIKRGSRSSQLCEIVGLMMIASSYLLFKEDTLWPGYNAMLPVLGTLLVIVASRNESIVTSNIAFQLIGKISYSIYLIHWPLIVFSRKINLDINPFLYFFLTVVIASVIYFTAEKNNKLSLTNISIFTFALLGSYYVKNTNGAEQRVPEELRLTKEQFQRVYYGGYGYKANEPYLSHADKGVDFIIFGDSFAAQYAKSIDDKKIKSVNMFFHGCPIMPNYSRFKDNKEDKNCSKAYGILLDVFQKYKDADVIFASAWDKYKDSLIKRGGNHAEKLSMENFYNIWIDEIKNIIKTGGDRHYYIIGVPMSTNPNSYGCLAQNILPGYALFGNCSATISKSKIEINDRIKHAFAEDRNVTFIDPNEALCEDDKCLVTIEKSPIYIDGSHLSVFGSKIVFDSVYDTISNNSAN